MPDFSRNWAFFYSYFHRSTLKWHKWQKHKISDVITKCQKRIEIMMGALSK